MGCHDSRPSYINPRQNLFLKSKYNHFFDAIPDSHTETSTSSSPKDFQQVLHTNSTEERLRAELKHEFENCKASEIYSYSLDLMIKPEEWEECMKYESYVIKTRYGSIFSEDIPVALVYLDFKSCVSSWDILQVLFDSKLRNKWDKTLERYHTIYSEKSNEFSVHQVSKFPIRNREMLIKVVISETQNETVIVMYSLNQEGFIPQPNTVKVELYFSMMKILEESDSTLMTFIMQIDGKIPSSATKLKLAYLSQWIGKFSKAVQEYQRQKQVL